jgi:hypothetical protein
MGLCKNHSTGFDPGRRSYTALREQWQDLLILPPANSRNEWRATDLADKQTILWGTSGTGIMAPYSDHGFTAHVTRADILLLLNAGRTLRRAFELQNRYFEISAA